jgi:hypothetical protein
MGIDGRIRHGIIGVEALGFFMNGFGRAIIVTQSRRFYTNEMCRPTRIRFLLYMNIAVVLV